MPDKPNDDSALGPLKDAGEDAAAAAIGAGLGTVIAGPIGAGVGLVGGPLLVGAAKAATIAIRKRLNNGARVLGVAADRKSITVDELLARFAIDPPRAELLARVLEAGGRSVLPGKIEALGQVLADGSDTDELDYPLALANALDALEGPAARALQAIANDGQRPKHEARAPLTGTIGTTADMLRADLPGDARLVDASLQVLRLHGLIRDIAKGSYGGNEGIEIFLATDVGQDCLRLLGIDEAPAAARQG